MIYCCGCQKEVEARLTNGKEIYLHREDLHDLPFWICDTCKNYVGCHHKTKDRIKPLGVIPTEEIRNARKHIHAIFDPLWKSRRFNRKNLYKIVSDKLGWNYHTANIKTIKEARKVYRILKVIEKGKTE